MRVAATQGTAVLFYSSDLDEVLHMADRVVVVANGKTHAVDGDATRSTVGQMMLVGSLSVAAGGDE